MDAEILLSPHPPALAHTCADAHVYTYTGMCTHAHNILRIYKHNHAHAHAHVCSDMRLHMHTQITPCSIVHTPTTCTCTHTCAHTCPVCTHVLTQLHAVRPTVVSVAERGVLIRHPLPSREWRRRRSAEASEPLQWQPKSDFPSAFFLTVTFCQGAIMLLSVRNAE